MGLFAYIGEKSFSNFAFKPTIKRANFIRLFQHSFPIQKKLIRCLRKMQKFLILLVEDVKKIRNFKSIELLTKYLLDFLVN